MNKKELTEADIRTNLLFFTKGKPIRIEEFEAERAWWGFGEERLQITS